MTNKNIKSLPFWETVGRSFKYVLKNKKLLIALLPTVGAIFVLQIILNLPLMCSYHESFCTKDWKNTLSVIISVIVAICIIINYCRSIICKENADFTSLKFFKRMLFYAIWSFLLTLSIAIPMSIFIVILSMIGASTNSILMLALFLFFVLGTVFAPLIVAFPAIAVDNYKIIKFSKLFELAKGNKMSIFFGQFFVMVPYMIISQMLTYIYTVIGTGNYFINLFFIFITVFLGLIDAGFKGAFFAHIYQFLTYYDKNK